MSALRADPVGDSTYSRDELLATGATIASLQRCDGLVLWSPGAHGDPWNHVEALMAFDELGEHARAAHGYDWLVTNQRLDGAWHAYYDAGGGIEDARLDTNATAYIAAGVWHHACATEDEEFLARMWPAVDKAITFTVARQRRGGGFSWSCDPGGEAASFALLAASSSICTSIEAALACAGALDVSRPAWRDALHRVRCAIAGDPGEFEPKDEYAMDAYYPVFSGALDRRAARDRLGAHAPRFFVPGRGVRCTSPGEWCTTAESAELSLAWTLVGDRDEAAKVLGTTRRFRDADGAYVTGLVDPGPHEFPPGERTSYSAAAIILAASFLDGSSTLREVFRSPPERSVATP